LGFNDPKIQFHKTIKEIEQRLGDDSVLLDSFIVSNTPSHTMAALWGIDKLEMDGRNILFQIEDKDSYIAAMLDRVSASVATS
jgi:hypothetical protein